jgi:predicted DNA-binding helix-hairpin-helix protein
VRRYGFSAGELVDENGNLPASRDPKTHWAMKNPWFFPLELEKASYSQLLRVPGIGPRLASRLIRLRKEGLGADTLVKYLWKTHRLKITKQYLLKVLREWQAERLP